MQGIGGIAQRQPTKTALLDEAFGLVEKARVADSMGDIRLARFFYIEAGESFIRAMKLESSEKVKERVKKEVKGFLSRAEELSSLLENVNVPSAPPPQYEEAAGENDDDSSVSDEKSGGMLEDALRADEEGEYEVAVDKYEVAAGIMLGELKLLGNNKDKKKKLQSKIKMILDRIEVLKRNAGEAKVGDGVENWDKFEVRKEKILEDRGGGDSGSLRAEEVDVLRKTSKIGGRTFYPWLEVDRLEKFKVAHGRFSDPDGKLTLSSKQTQYIASWKRPDEFIKQVEPKAIVLISPFSIKQTLITDCSFVSAISVAANYERTFKKRLLTNSLFPQDKHGNPRYNPWGKYMIKLHINGVDRKVVIDDSLPVDSYDNLLCSYSVNYGELWVSLFEKAFLKVMGGYNFPGSNGGIDLHYLTGWIPERVSLKQDCKDDGDGLDRYWERIYSGHNYGDCLVTCGTGPMTNAEADMLGLVPTHAYAILRVEKVGNLRLLLLKNPWAHKGWKGKFSAQDGVNWTPQLREAVGYDRMKALKADDGIFWIDWDSLCDHWDSVYLNWNPGLFKQRTSVHASWPSNIGPANDSIDMGANPQYRLKVPKKGTTIWVLLSKHLTQIKELEKEDFITLHVYTKTAGRRVFYPTDAYRRGVYMNSPFYLLRWESEVEDAVYTLVVSQYMKRNDLYFTVDVYATENFSMAELKRAPFEVQLKEECWREDTAGGSSNAVSYWSNPQYRMRVRNNAASVKVLLKAPEKISVNVIVMDSGGSRVSSWKTPRVGDSGSYRNGFCVAELDQLKPGLDYTVIPSTWNAGETAPFILSVLSFGAQVFLEPLQ